ncbi:glycosyltransferase [Patescibacteria group bacterium]|nr:glycosyltransferase [Patescibacteria group bacterium]
MKIQYLAFIRLPTEKAHGLQIMKTCEALAEEGHEVELVIPGRKTHIEDDAFSYHGSIQNFKIKELRTPDFVQAGPVGFFISLVCFAEAAVWRISYWTADVIFSRDALVLFQHILLGKKFVYEAHNNPSWVSAMIAKRAKVVVSISEGLKQAYVMRGVAPERIIVVPDAVDLKMFEKSLSKIEARRRLSIPEGEKIALYVGRIDGGKGADVFAASSQFLPEGVRAVLIGNGPLVHNLKSTHTKAFFIPETKYVDLPNVLPVADVLVLPNSGKGTESARNTSPLKLFAYMASGIPIVSSDVPAVREILSDDSAVFVKPDDAQALADGIRACVEGVGVGKGENAKALAIRYSWGSRARRILEALR